MPNQKQPITPAMLLQIHGKLNLAGSTEASFWATCLVAFYGMFRKSHLLPMTPNLFDSRKQLTKADFKIFSWGTLVTVRWSKTIQFHERLVEIPLPRIPGSPIYVLQPPSSMRFTFRQESPLPPPHRRLAGLTNTRPRTFLCTVYLFPYCVSILRR